MKKPFSNVLIVLLLAVTVGCTKHDSATAAEPASSPTLPAVAATPERAPAATPDRPSATALRHPLWVIESAQNRTYLLGSIHVLRDEDYPLPHAFQKAYDDAEHLVMELDFSSFDAMTVMATTRQLAMLPENQTLRDAMGDKNYALAEQKARAINVDLTQFDRVEPWYAALTITQVQLGKLGFKAENGVEFYFERQAKDDDKTGSGLETFEQQLGILDALPIDAQNQFLLEALVPSDELIAEGDRMIDAWKTGQADKLFDLFEEDLKNNPALREALLVKRNREWLPKIMALTERDDNVLVIVGALHLVGDDGVIAMLREQGLTVRQL
ncbi:MAG: TraB/GumN family protein [Pseudomonadota bacterium]